MTNESTTKRSLATNPGRMKWTSVGVNLSRVHRSMLYLLCVCNSSSFDRGRYCSDTSLLTCSFVCTSNEPLACDREVDQRNHIQREQISWQEERILWANSTNQWPKRILRKLNHFLCWSESISSWKCSSKAMIHMHWTWFFVYFSPEVLEVKIRLRSRPIWSIKGEVLIELIKLLRAR